jgi:peptidoglycan/xylan/chitin deacetylase (PgdA/CDA1 family)
VSISSSVVSCLAHGLPATRAGRLLILIYHRVRQRPDPMFPGEVDALRFDGQMALLRRHCHPMPLRAATAQLKDGSLPSRAVAVTFDDGYADNATVAQPILRRHQIPATFFITAGYLDGGRMWNDSIIEAIRCATASSLDLTDLGLGTVELGTQCARGAVADSIISKVKHMEPRARQAKVDSLCRRTACELPDDLMMTSAQVRELVDSGMEIAAHTMTHPILRSITLEEARREIDESRRRLQSITGQPVEGFAYPNGRPQDDYTERDRNLVEELGFRYALATVNGSASRHSDRFQLPRFTPWDRRPERWLARLMLAFAKPA